LLDGDVVGTSIVMSEEAKKTRWGSGFLWGCLTPILIVAALIAAGLVYAGYYFVSGYKNDDTLQTVIAAVRVHPVAREVLGDNIDISGFPTFNVKYDIASGHTASYEFDVKGTKAGGRVQAALVITDHKTRFTSLTLTGPDGTKYDLLGHPGQGAAGQQAAITAPPFPLAAAASLSL
jgi:hypothetical protein